MPNARPHVPALLFLLLVPLTAFAGAASAPTPSRALYGLPPVPREAFNRAAAALGLPLFWTSDDDGDGLVDPAEVAPVDYGHGAPRLVEGGGFSADFERLYREVVEALRRDAVRRELDQGRPTLVRTTLATLPAHEKAFVRHVLAAARTIEALHAEQRGVAHFAGELERLDPVSQAAFWRNQGPWCTAPATESDPLCNALPAFPPRQWGIYPAGLAHDAALCARLAAHPQSKALLDPFTVVRLAPGAKADAPRDEDFVAVPYTEAYAQEMGTVARELRAAADALDGHGEDALVRYLQAAARAFETNAWPEADEAWAAMNAQNSAWYLRIGPDEVYWDVCQEKAGFHVSFARIDKGSLEWQEKLTPLRDELEGAMARLIGPAYQARAVRFHMPDFIEIVLNAGDARSPMGATVGQSLPNWGPVAEEGRGRTVVMTNLYTDPDSNRISRARAELLLSPAAMAHWTEEPRPSLVGIILHEAAHNLGPCSDYEIDGRDPGEIFGGRMASLLEELKAQTASLFYAELLRAKGVLDDETARQIYATSLTWALGHAAQGMVTADGVPKTYSQLAAVQIGFFVEAGVLTWKESPETDGDDPGRFDIDYARFPEAVEALMQRVARIKATGDAAGAQALVEPYVTGARHALLHPEVTRERYQRHPKATFLYTVDL